MHIAQTQCETWYFVKTRVEVQKLHITCRGGRKVLVLSQSNFSFVLGFGWKCNDWSDAYCYTVIAEIAKKFHQLWTIFKKSLFGRAQFIRVGLLCGKWYLKGYGQNTLIVETCFSILYMHNILYTFLLVFWHLLFIRLTVRGADRKP